MLDVLYKKKKKDYSVKNLIGTIQAGHYIQDYVLCFDILQQQTYSQSLGVFSLETMPLIKNILIIMN